MTGDTGTLEQLKRALQAQHQALEALEDALLAELESHAQQDGAGRKLHSLKEVCQELGMSKGWVYQRIRRGEIRAPSSGTPLK